MGRMAAFILGTVSYPVVGWPATGSRLAKEGEGASGCCDHVHTMIGKREAPNDGRNACIKTIDWLVHIPGKYWIPFNVIFHRRTEKSTRHLSHKSSMAPAEKPGIPGVAPAAPHPCRSTVGMRPRLRGCLGEKGERRGKGSKVTGACRAVPSRKASRVEQSLVTNSLLLLSPYDLSSDKE